MAPLPPPPWIRPCLPDIMTDNLSLSHTGIDID